jgi:surfeit locus 1 family protein
MPPKFHARPGPTVLILGGLVLLTSLGSWQTRRYYEKRDVEATIQRTIHAQPTPVATLAQLSDPALAYHKLSIPGTLDTRYNILFRHRQLDGHPGYWLATPLVLPDGKSAILVNRGWLPVDKGAELANTLPAPDATALVGVLHIPEQLLPDDIARKALAGAPIKPDAPPTQWRSLDLDAITGAMPYTFPSPASIFTLDAQHSGAPLPVASVDYLTAPYLTSDRHLGYAAFWFACALALAGLGLAAGFRVLR